jgi:hypothetical protein
MGLARMTLPPKRPYYNATLNPVQGDWEGLRILDFRFWILDSALVLPGAVGKRSALFCNGRAIFNNLAALERLSLALF